MGFIKIVNEDGLSRHTRIFDEEGKDITNNASKMVIILDSNDVVKAWVKYVFPRVEIKGKKQDG